MSFAGRMRELLDNKLKRFTGNPGWQRGALVVLFYTVIFLMLYLTLMSSRVELKLGKPSPRRIVAEREAIDQYATERLREEAASSVAESYDYDPTVLDRATDLVAGFFAKVKEVRAQTASEAEKIAHLMANVPIELTQPQAVSLLETRSQDLTEMQEQLLEVLQMILQQGVKPSGLETARRQAAQEISFLIFEQDQKRVMVKLAEAAIEANMIYNAEATEKAREAARNAVEPVRILEGDEIIRTREIVTQRHLEQLEALGLLRSTTGYPLFFGLFLILIILFVIVGLYLYIYQQEIYHDPKRLLLLGLIVVLTLTFSIAANYFSGYLVPVAMGTILIAVLLNGGLAVVMSIVFSVFVVLLTGNDFRFMLIALFGGLIGACSVTRLHRRSDLTRAGLYVSAINLVAFLGLFLYAGTMHLDYDALREFSINIIATIGNGIFSAVMAIGLLPYLESGFGLTTSVTLLELANPGHPLLKKLLMEAPGTYHHSLVVANLAEAAAEAVGADPLLARVGAFYHDIGKLKRPYFFIENQLGENPHEKISPNLSTLIITSHIKDGLELAKKYKLPKVIQDIVIQHHGNSLISYFYQQAGKNAADRESLREEDFRYDAPLPQTKEAAIVLLADSVEAAVRSLSKPSAGRVEAVIRKIIKDKLNDGQFDGSDLTLKDLDTIASTFVKILGGIYHSRIEYPEKELKAEVERGRKNAGSGE